MELWIFQLSADFRISRGTKLGCSSISGMHNRKVINICCKRFYINCSKDEVGALVGYKADITDVKNIFGFMTKQEHPINAGIKILELWGIDFDLIFPNTFDIR